MASDAPEGTVVMPSQSRNRLLAQWLRPRIAMDLALRIV